MTSFDHLVCSLLEMQGHIEAKGLGRLHIDNHLELDWGLHGKLTRLCAPEDTIDIGRGKTKRIDLFISVR